MSTKPLWCRGQWFVLASCLALSGMLLFDCTNAVADEPAPKVVQIRYRSLIDRDVVTHAGITVGELVDQMAKREPSAIGDLLGGLLGSNRSINALLEPHLEPMAYLLECALLQAEPERLNKPLIDIGTFFPSGSAQPAWADLLRTRYFYVLSDGKGYVRVFLPGDSAERAYEANSDVLQQVLEWIVNSNSSKDVTAELFAYRHKFRGCELQLNLRSKIVKYSGGEPSKRDLVPLDLEGIGLFFSDGYQLEGATIDSTGKLVLFGSKPKQEPTLAEVPISIADLAVAYRAARFKAQGETYMSLDRSPYPEQVNVNFGGRLEDTRLGWVTLACDVRFKSIAFSLDPWNGGQLANDVRKEIPDFLTQIERFYRAKEMPSSEETRYWFYPDKFVVDASDDTVVLTHARYTASAERQNASRGNPRETPAWTRDTLEHMNRHYDQFAGLFPELRELDDVARLLALGEWMAEYRRVALKKGLATPDFDALLSIELPRFQTPRRLHQTLISYAQVKGEKDSQLLLFDCTNVAQKWIDQRTSGDLLRRTSSEQGVIGILADAFLGRDQDVDDRFQTELLMEDVSSEGLRRIQQYAENSQFTPKQVGDLKESAYTVITGGLDLDLQAKLRRPLKIAESDIELIRKLRDGNAIQPIRLSKTERDIYRMRVLAESIVPPPPKKPPTRNHAIPDPPEGNQGNWTGSIGQTDSHRVVSPGGEELFGYDGVGNVSEGRFGRSQGVYFQEHGQLRRTAAQFTFYDNGYSRRYRLDSNDLGNGRRLFVAHAIDGNTEFARPIESEVVMAARAFGASKQIRETWNSLPDGSPVLAVQRLNQTDIGVLTYGKIANESQILHVIRDGAVADTIPGKEAIDRLIQSTNDVVQRTSNDNVSFVHVWMNKGRLHAQVGSKKVECSLSELNRLLENPTIKESVSFDAIFSSEASPKDFVVIRGPLDQRPERLGGSLRKGQVDEPVRVCAMLKERYREKGKRVHLDDDPEAAKRRLSLLRPVKSTDDVAFVTPASELVRPQDRDIFKKARDAWKNSGFRVYNALSEQIPEKQLCVLTAHNDEELFKYLEQLGENGILQGRTWLIFTCGEPGNSNMFTDLLDRYDANGISVTHSPLRSRLVGELLEKLPEVISQKLKSGSESYLFDLVREALAPLFQKYPGGENNEYLKRLRDAVLQLSKVQTHKRGAANVS